MIEEGQFSPKIRYITESILAYQPESIYLFGSWAAGEQDEASDIDIVIIKHTEAPFFERLREAGRHLPADVGGVDLLVYTPQEFAEMLDNGNAFAEMIREEGRSVYARQTKERSQAMVSTSRL